MNKYLDFTNYSPLRVALIVLFVSIMMTQFVAFRIYTVVKENEQLQVKHEAIQIKNQFENVLKNSESATKIMAFLVKNQFAETYFDSVSNNILLENKYIDAIQLVEGKTITKVFPMQGNEKVIGYEVLDDSMHNRAALTAIERSSLFFEGPILLKQGGEGVVGRLPVYIKNELWGFAAVIIKKETLLKSLGVNEKGRNESYTYQISKVDGFSMPFFKPVENETALISYKTNLSAGDWEIAVTSNQPQFRKRTIQFSILGLLFSFTLAFLFYNLVNQPRVLKKVVKDKTKDLAILNQALQNRAQELINSNKELEQFAYIASHDLQEPLRMINNFLTQLEKKYADQLDDKAKQYIHFAVDGAKRMRAIILDILEFSRIGKYEEAPQQVNMNQVLDEVCTLLNSVIIEKQATIQYPNLPILITHQLPVQQIFMNLISNSLKYCKEEVIPIITIAAEEKQDFWEFSVSDNGIGIEKEYYDRIFEIFQRLHSKGEYSGTGVGLAIVKKTIENLGGKVWLESKIDIGTTFYFTLPKNNQLI
jgi:signal transduction histidine kinase